MLKTTGAGGLLLCLLFWTAGLARGENEKPPVSTEGLIYINGNFFPAHEYEPPAVPNVPLEAVEPVATYAFDISDPVEVGAAITALPSLRMTPNGGDTRVYAQTIRALLAAKESGLEDFPPATLQDVVDNDLQALMAAIEEARRSGDAGTWASLLNSLVKVLEVEGYREGPVAEVAFNNLMSRHVLIPDEFKEYVDWTIEVDNPAALYQPTGSNVGLAPLLGRVFKLDGPDTLTSLFGSPATTGIVGADLPVDAQRVVATTNGSARTFYWNNSLGRWTRVSLGSPDMASADLEEGSLVVLMPPPST